MISVLHSVLGNIASFGRAIARKPPRSGRLLPILAVLGNVVLVVLLAPALNAQDLTLLPLYSGSAANITVVAFLCDIEGDHCPNMTIDREFFGPAPEWALTLTLVEVCPTNDAAWITTRGPVGIKWPGSLILNLEISPECNIQPLIYFHDEPDGSHVGLRFDPKTQRLSVEQSEVAYR